MDILFKALAILTPMFMIWSFYYRYKHQDDAPPKPSWLEKQPFVQYFFLVFVERIRLRSASAFFFLPMFMGIFLGTLTLISCISNLVVPPIPLEQMSTKQGIIESITIHKKMMSSLLLRLPDGTKEEFAYYPVRPVGHYLDQNVTVYYARGWSSGFTIDNCINQIEQSGTHLILHAYDYERKLAFAKGKWTFTKYCFYTAAFSMLIIWLLNRKELPIHRLNRIKLNRKLEQQKAKEDKWFNI